MTTNQIVRLFAGNPRGDGNLALASAITVDLELHPREWILRRSRLIRELPETHRPIGGEDDFAPAIRQRPLLGEAQVIADGAWRVDAADRAHIPQRIQQSVLSFLKECLLERRALSLC